MSDKRHFSDCLKDLAASLPIITLALSAALLVSSDRLEASGRENLIRLGWRCHTARSFAVQKPIAIRASAI